MQTDRLTDGPTNTLTNRRTEITHLIFCSRTFKYGIPIFHTLDNPHFTLSYPQAAPPSSLHVTKLVNKYCSQLKNLVIPTDQNYMTICEK